MSCSEARISRSPLRTTGWSSAISTFTAGPPDGAFSPWRASMDGNRHLHPRPLVAFPADLDRATERQRALADSHQAERFRALYRHLAYAAAVVFHRQHERIFIRLHADIDPGRVR